MWLSKSDWISIISIWILFDNYAFNTLRPRQNGRHLPDDTFKWIFLNENVWISINISLKFVPRGLINNIPTLVQVMAWRRLGDKPLSEPMMVRLPTHICVTLPPWVKKERFWQKHTCFPCQLVRCYGFWETFLVTFLETFLEILSVHPWAPFPCTVISAEISKVISSLHPSFHHLSSP